MAKMAYTQIQARINKLLNAGSTKKKESNNTNIYNALIYLFLQLNKRNIISVNTKILLFVYNFSKIIFIFYIFFFFYFVHKEDKFFFFYIFIQ